MGHSPCGWGKRLQNSMDIINPFKTKHRCTRVRSDSICIKEQKQAQLSLLSEVRIMVTLGVGLQEGRRWSSRVWVTLCHDPVLCALVGSAWENAASWMLMTHERFCMVSSTSATHHYVFIDVYFSV